MKNIILSLSIIIFGFQTISAQTNVVKFGSIDFIKLGVSYERVINEKQSFNIQIGFVPGRSLPASFDSQNAGEFDFDAKYSGFSIVPEYRFYTGNNDAPHGFYMAPYLKYSRYDLSSKEKYKNYEINVDGTYKSIGLGGEIGYQWIISEVFSIDWTIIGLEIDRNSVFLRYQSDEDGIDFKEIEELVGIDLAELPIVSDKFSLESGDDFVEGKAPFLFGGIRFGISVGYAF